MMGWTSPVLANMAKNDTKSMEDNPLGVVVTDDETSWVGSLMTLGAVVGSVFSGYIGERCDFTASLVKSIFYQFFPSRFGRKKALLATVIPFLLGWALVATAKSLEQLLAARFIFGIAIAISFTVVPMYCGEIAEVSSFFF